MKRTRFTTQLIATFLLLPLISNAETVLPSFFSDNMVLQQNEEASIWGKDTPGTNIHITASWGAQSSANTGKDGNWKTTIATPTAGGPFSIKISGSDEIVLNDVLTGEVWLCSGQSNMEMPFGIGFHDRNSESFYERSRMLAKPCRPARL